MIRYFERKGNFKRASSFDVFFESSTVVKSKSSGTVPKLEMTL